MRSVIFENNTINYTLTYKRVKNINLRIKSDCSITVSANRRVPLSVIDDFVFSKGEFILKALEKYSERQKYLQREIEFNDGDLLIFLGSQFTLKVIEDEQENIERCGDNILMTVKRKDDLKRKKLLFGRWTNERCRAVFGEILEEEYRKIQDYGIPFPQLKLRCMKSRWGSCQPKTGIITLNTRLIETPKICIRYVALHELSHFIHPNHSKNFYLFLEKLMPDWKEQKKILENRDFAKSTENY